MSKISRRLEREAEVIRSGFENQAIWSEGKYGTPVTINKIERYSKTYTREDIKVSREEFDTALTMAAQHLHKQRRDDILGDSSHLQLERGAIVKFYPTEARGKIEVKMRVTEGSHKGVFIKPADVIVRTTDTDFRQQFMKSGSPIRCEVQIADRLQMRLERLSSPSRQIEYEHKKTFSYDDYLSQNKKGEAIYYNDQDRSPEEQLSMNFRNYTPKIKQWDTERLNERGRLI